MFIPLTIKNGKKRPIKKGWQKNFTMLPEFHHKKQTNIGLMNFYKFCIDVDHPEMFHNFPEILEKMKLVGPIIKTSRGYHFYFKNSELNKLFVQKDRSIIFLPWGELRTNMSYQAYPNSVFNVKLDNEKVYTPINFNTWDEFNNSLQDLPEDLIESIFKISIKSRLTYQEVKEVKVPKTLTPITPNTSTSGDTFGVHSLLPDTHGKNHHSIFMLCRWIMRNSLEDKRDEIFQEWLSKNEFLRHGQNYEQEFSDMWKYIDVSKCGIKHKELFNLHFVKATHRSKQKRINYALEEMFKVIGKNGQFSFGQRNLEPIISKKEVARGLAKLIKDKKIELVKRGWSYRPNKTLMASEYRLVEKTSQNQS